MWKKNEYDPLYEVLKTTYDIVRLRRKVSMMSFVSESICLVRIPRVVHDEE